MLTRRGPFLVAAAAGTVTLTAASAPSPLYPAYQQLWHFSDFTLTLIFAVYVFALLASLLTVGSLSDRVGRRPVAAVALLLLALGMLLFALADGTGALMAARVVQGFAVGAATGTTTAMILDTAPGQRTGSIVSSAVPTLGIAIGAVLAGALVQYAPYPRQLVFWVLGTAFLLLAVLVLLVPESRRRDAIGRPPLWRTLLPSVALPRVTRPVFGALVPSMIATWALGGLYLSLGSSVVGTVLGVRSHLVVGMVLGVFFASGVLGSTLSTSLPARVREPAGYGALATGVLLTLAALLARDLPLYVVGSAVAGVGFGASFRYAVGSLGQAAPADERGEVFATMYIVSYLAFSLPALAAGVAVGHVGLRPTVLAYGLLDVVLVGLAAAAGELRRRADAGPDPVDRRLTTAPQSTNC